jgi:hypothetical protein
MDLMTFEFSFEITQSIETLTFEFSFEITL